MPVITLKQASKDYFGGVISESKLYDLVRQNKIPVIRISSRKIYFNTDRLDRWLEEMDSMKVEEDIGGYGTLRAMKSN